MSETVLSEWSSPIPRGRWDGFRRVYRGVEAFQSLSNFEEAAKSELENSLKDHERKTLGRLLERGKKDEIEIFLRTHGANPISDPEEPINVNLFAAKADIVDLKEAASAESHQSVLNGDVVHVLFQAGEATRFNRGPLFSLNLLDVARELKSDFNLNPDLEAIDRKRNAVPADVFRFLTEGPLGPKQPVFIRAAVRRIVHKELSAKRIRRSDAASAYASALSLQKVLFFVGQQGGMDSLHDKALRTAYSFYGLNPRNLVTVRQELSRGFRADLDGAILPTSETDAAGHLYAFLQAARTGDFTTYTDSGKPVKPMETDAFAYLGSRGGRYLNIVRINDMDRHTTEIVNTKALSYALKMFRDGYANLIECVANTGGQKGGTGTAFDNPDIHVLTETHENSFPVLSRAMEAAIKKYLEENKGRHPAYNAMRQWADLTRTRRVLKEFGGRIVFVPRQKTVDGRLVTYVGVDMPIGDLSFFTKQYRSRMFQFVGPAGRELQIHDMKKPENIPIALRTIRHQLDDTDIIDATTEVLTGRSVGFKPRTHSSPSYGAPAPEFAA